MSEMNVEPRLHQNRGSETPFREAELQPNMVESNSLRTTIARLSDRSPYPTKRAAFTPEKSRLRSTLQLKCVFQAEL